MATSSLILGNPGRNSRLNPKIWLLIKRCSCIFLLPSSITDDRMSWPRRSRFEYGRGRGQLLRLFEKETSRVKEIPVPPWRHSVAKKRSQATLPENRSSEVCRRTGDWEGGMIWLEPCKKWLGRRHKNGVTCQSPSLLTPWWQRSGLWSTLFSINGFKNIWLIYLYCPTIVF